MLATDRNSTKPENSYDDVFRSKSFLAVTIGIGQEVDTSRLIQNAKTPDLYSCTVLDDLPELSRRIVDKLCQATFPQLLQRLHHQPLVLATMYYGQRMTVVIGNRKGLYVVVARIQITFGSAHVSITLLDRYAHRVAFVLLVFRARVQYGLNSRLHCKNLNYFTVLYLVFISCH